MPERRTYIILSSVSGAFADGCTAARDISAPQRQSGFSVEPNDGTRSIIDIHANPLGVEQHTRFRFPQSRIGIWVNMQSDPLIQINYRLPRGLYRKYPTAEIDGFRPDFRGAKAPPLKWRLSLKIFIGRQEPGKERRVAYIEIRDSLSMSFVWRRT